MGYLNGRPVYLVGFPVRDARRSEPEAVTRIFRDVYNVKRVQPGVLRGEDNAFNVRLLRHDCAPLGQNTGAPIVDLETNLVLGMQLTGRYLEGGTAVPLYALRDPLFYGTLPDVWDVVYLVVETMAALAVGAWVFRRVDDRIAVEL